MSFERTQYVLFEMQGKCMEDDSRDVPLGETRGIVQASVSKQRVPCLCGAVWS